MVTVSRVANRLKYMTMIFGNKKILATGISAAVKNNTKGMNALLSIALLACCNFAHALTSIESEITPPAVAKIAVIAEIQNQHSTSHEYSFQIAQPEKLAKKLYRKALFHYFQGQPELALRQLTYNKARLAVVDDNALLFEAGLQVSLGLYRQAEINLTAITEKLSNNATQTSLSNDEGMSINAGERFDYFASQDLLAVALLQLAEQQINRQQQVKAQLTLAKLNHLPDGYYQQYHILSQLAYWPQPAQLALEIPMASEAAKHKQADAYILLNMALLAIEQQDIESAEQKLLTLKRMSWQTPQKSFWLQLFASDDSTKLESTAGHEQQSLQDYASLLLAQLYVEQEQFSLAYKELANFPQDSPFTEQALFLFAYASLKTQHYPESEAIFSLLSTRYPSSYLGWQADVLLARQYLVQRELDTALRQYLQLETKYQEQLLSLTQFEQQIIASPIAITGNSLSDDNALDSVWWQKALASVKLTGQFGKANELAKLNNQIAKQQQQVQWLNYAIELNEARQKKIIAQQQAKNYQASIAQLQNRRNQLDNKLAEVAQHADAKVFAVGQQKQWLQRIATSKSVIKAMTASRHYQNKVHKYQQRLTRVEGVLAWQLQQEFPQRLWQHQTQLQQLDKSLTQLQQQMQQVTAIQQLANKSNEAPVNTLASESVVDDKSLASKTGLDLPTLKHRQQKIAYQHARLTQAATALGNLTDKNIQAELLAFVAEQRQSLNYYLHHSRRAMAKILEELKKVDIAGNNGLSDSDNIGVDE